MTVVHLRDQLEESTEEAIEDELRTPDVTEMLETEEGTDLTFTLLG